MLNKTGGVVQYRFRCASIVKFTQLETLIAVQYLS